MTPFEILVIGLILAHDVVIGVAIGWFWVKYKKPIREVKKFVNEVSDLCRGLSVMVNGGRK